MKDVGVMKDEEVNLEDIEVSRVHTSWSVITMDLCGCVSEYYAA